MITIDEQEYDDMRRCIGIIASSGTPSPDGGCIYSVHQHELAVKHCQDLILFKNLK